MADNKNIISPDAFSTAADHDEFAAAEEQAKTSESAFTVKLKKPFT